MERTAQASHSDLVEFAPAIGIIQNHENRVPEKGGIVALHEDTRRPQGTPRLRKIEAYGHLVSFE